MAKRKRNKKEQTFDVYPYLGGTQHFMIGGATPRLHKLQDGKEKKDGIVEDKVTYEKPTGYRQFLTDYNVSPSSPSLLGQVGTTLSAGSDLLDQWGGVLDKDSYKPGGKYSKWGPDGLRYGNISLTNTRDENALIDVENMMKYVDMNKKNKKNVISSDIWKTPDEMQRGHWDYMNLDKDGNPTFKGLDFEVSKRRSEEFTNPDKGTCSKPEFTTGAECEANGGTWTGDKLFGIKTRNEDGSFTYRDENGVPITTGPGSEGTIYDQIEDKKGPGGLYDANADLLQFDFDKGTCDDGVSTTMEECAAAGANWIKDENSLSKVRHYGEDEKGVIDEHVVDYDPNINFSDWETKNVVKTSKQDEINCELSGCNGAPGKWVVTEAGGQCDCGGGTTDEDNVGGGCASMNLCDDPNNPGECIPCEEAKYGAELPKAQFGYMGSRDGRSNTNQSLKLAGTTALASMLTRAGITGVRNRNNYKNAYDDYINNQGPDWYDEMCTEQSCPSWEKNRLELLDGHSEPDFGWFKGTNDNLFGKQSVMNKNNVLQKGDLADAYWQNIKQGAKDGLYTGAINYGLNYLTDRTRVGRNVKNWWQDNNLPTINVGYLSRKYGGGLPKYQNFPKLEEGGSWWDSFTSAASNALDYTQTALSAGGLTPGVGIIPDAANTLISGARTGYAALTGDKEGVKKHGTSLALNAGSMIPVVGQGFGVTSLANDAKNYASSDNTTTNPNQITMNKTKTDVSNVTRYGGQLPKFPVGGPFVDDLEGEGVTDQNTQIEEAINPYDPYETGRGMARFGGALPFYEEGDEVDEELDAEEETFIEPEGDWATVNVGGVQTKVPFDQRSNYSSVPGQENSNPEMAGLEYQRAVNVANQSNDPGIDVNYGDNIFQKGWNKTRETLNTGIVGGLLDGVIGGSSTEAQCSDTAYADKNACEEAGETWTEATKGTGLVNFAFENLLPMANNIIGQNREHQYELSKQGMSSENFASTMESSTNRNTMGTNDINKGGYGDDLYGTGEVFGQLAQEGMEMQQEPQKDFSALSTFMNLVNDKEDVRFNTEELQHQKLHNGKMQRGGEPNANQILDDPTFRVWYARNARRSDVMNVSSNPEQLKVLFLIDIGMDEAPVFSNEISDYGNIDKSNRSLGTSLHMLDNPIKDVHSPMINWQEGLGGKPEMIQYQEGLGGKPKMNTGGQVLDIDDAMLKELIAAGADIEYI